MPAQSPQLRDLATILYTPRVTMRRILDAGRDRWAAPLMILAFVVSTVSDPDWRHINVTVPDLSPLTSMTLALLAMILFSAIWVGTFYLLSWLVALAGRLFGGAATVADIRAAMAWGLVPMIWSVFVRIPIAIYQGRLNIPRHVQGTDALMNFIAQGGCALAVVVFAMQTIVFCAWVFVTSCTLGEAQRFSSAKGLGNLALALIGPVLIVAAAVFAFRH